ncbi:hypothetical protein OSTOST_13609 [Ostertagia ostertagi]
MSIHLLGRNVMQSDAARLAGCNQSTVSRVLKNFVRAINRRASEYISWPSERESIGINASFYSRYHLPGIVGVIDGTHCRIQRPTHNEEDFVCRKGYHSINVGVVVDYNMKVSGYAPTGPDLHTIPTYSRHRTLYQQLRAGEVQEERYNRAVCSARVRVEQAFGVIKRQFHILHGECRYSPERAAEIVVACCVLRNIAIQHNEPVAYDEYTGEDRQDEEVPSRPSDEIPSESALTFVEKN